MNIKIPKNLKKVRTVKLTSEDLITFEKKIQKVYENGDINAPIHLSSGNENELISIFHVLRLELNIATNKYINKKEQTSYAK